MKTYYTTKIHKDFHEQFDENGNTLRPETSEFKEYTFDNEKDADWFSTEAWKYEEDAVDECLIYEHMDISGESDQYDTDDLLVCEPREVQLDEFKEWIVKGPQDPPLWESKLDGKYHCSVHRMSPYQGLLLLNEDTTNLLTKDVTVSYNALFGPDVQDVTDWQNICIDFIDNQE